MAIEVKKVLAEIEAGPSKTIKVSVVNNGKNTFLDIRQWEKSERYEGPTKKGVWLDWDSLNKIVDDKILEKAIEVMDKLA